MDRFTPIFSDFLYIIRSPVSAAIVVALVFLSSTAPPSAAAGRSATARFAALLLNVVVGFFVLYAGFSFMAMVFRAPPGSSLVIPGGGVKYDVAVMSLFGVWMQQAKATSVGWITACTLSLVFVGILAALLQGMMTAAGVEDPRGLPDLSLALALSLVLIVVGGARAFGRWFAGRIEDIIVTSPTGPAMDIAKLLASIVVLGIALLAIRYAPSAFQAGCALILTLAGYPLILAAMRVEKISEKTFKEMYIEGLKQIPVVGGLFGRVLPAGRAPQPPPDVADNTVAGAEAAQAEQGPPRPGV